MNRIATVCGLWLAGLLGVAPAFEAPAKRAASRPAAVIDAEIDRALATAGIVSSPRADDAEFLRRVHFDLVGTIPTLERVKQFLADDDSNKRAKLIDDLLADPRFGRHLAEQWADLLIKRDFDANRNLQTEPFIDWLAGRINSDTGWDAIVRAMITVNGPADENPAALFVLANQDMFQPSPAKLAGATTNLFMGVSLHCAECHEHPTIPGWTQQDFWGMAAFFGHLRLDREGMAPAAKNPNPPTLVEVDRQSAPRGRLAKKNGERAIAPGATIAIPDPTDDKKTIGVAPAKFFGGAAPKLNSVPYRPALASWLTAPDNGLFAQATVNRVWAQMFARGLIHPIEEAHDGNPPSHPAILQLLADELVRSEFELKAVFRAICNSDAYQRTSRPSEGNADDVTLLSHLPVKMLGSRALLASIATITGVTEKAPEVGRRPVPPVKRPPPFSAQRFFDAREYDDDATEYSFGVPQMLKQMNTSLTLRSRELANRIAKANAGDRDATIHDIYLTILCRPPRTAELERMRDFAARSPDGLAGIAWALMNSAEFVSNH